MNAHKAKMRGNEGPQGQMQGNESLDGKKLQNGAGHGSDKSIVRTLGKRAIFGNLWAGTPEADPEKPKWKEVKAQKAKMQGNEGPQGQNTRKWRPTRPKCKEMKAHKAKMHGNEGPQGQNARNPPSRGGARARAKNLWV